MADYHEKLAKAGVLLDASGLQPTSKGWRVKYSGGKRTIVDGPFTEAKELIAGYTMIQVKSREEAIEWSRRFPNPTHRRQGLRDRGPAIVRARRFRRERSARPVPRAGRAEIVQAEFEHRRNDDAIPLDGENERSEDDSNPQGHDGRDQCDGGRSRQGRLRHGAGRGLAADFEWHAGAACRRQAHPHRRPVHRGQGGGRWLCHLRMRLEGADAQMDRALHGTAQEPHARLGRRVRSAPDPRSGPGSLRPRRRAPAPPPSSAACGNGGSGHSRSP